MVDRMPQVTFQHPDGSQSVVSASAGVSVMKTAIANDIAEIVGECGGSLMCATCHVYLESGRETLPPCSDEEEDLLEATAAPRLPASRLSCQLVLGEDSDVVVMLPTTQY